MLNGCTKCDRMGNKRVSVGRWILLQNRVPFRAGQKKSVVSVSSLPNPTLLYPTLLYICWVAFAGTKGAGDVGRTGAPRAGDATQRWRQSSGAPSVGGGQVGDARGGIEPEEVKAQPEGWRKIGEERTTVLELGAGEIFSTGERSKK